MFSQKSMIVLVLFSLFAATSAEAQLFRRFRARGQQAYQQQQAQQYQQQYQQQSQQQYQQPRQTAQQVQSVSPYAYGYDNTQQGRYYYQSQTLYRPQCQYNAYAQRMYMPAQVNYVVPNRLLPPGNVAMPMQNGIQPATPVVIDSAVMEAGFNDGVSGLDASEAHPSVDPSEPVLVPESAIPVMAPDETVPGEIPIEGSQGSEDFSVLESDG